MSIKIALAGNPNCGKTTLFNNLTGSNQYVGNLGDAHVHDAALDRAFTVQLCHSSGLADLYVFQSFHT